ncbi:low conductance mechanosensitive channel YnaI [bacterium BMS3Abin07]|nr:low conductance mechanosensitive channel YnaI [bacterium BMS3Abin07]HDO22430.1 mechanosensitive ion channel family protein [Nitrospirota bacterium]HDZ88344.1 mechanosensitive ion channel family protein [Nitrospirota bacterium]
MFEDIMQISFLRNRILDYLIFFSILFIGILAIRIFRHLILNRLRAWAEKTATDIDDFLLQVFEKTLLPILYFGIFYLSTRSLTLNAALNKIVYTLGVIVLTVFGIRFLVALINYTIETYLLKKEKDAIRERNLKGIITVIKVVIWGLGITFLLDNLGFKISSVIAGLGIGGVAVALAAQTVLGDLFSYFAIFFDRPFEVGDFIIVGEYMGSIEDIGIKTTRIRSLSGEQLVFSNTDLTNSRVRNYKRMEKRRVVFKLGVTYQTSLQQLKEIPVVITGIIKNVNDTVFDRAHFSSYGDFSLIFEVVYYVNGSDYNKYMNIQQEINLEIMEEFEKRRIEFAYPTQTIFLEKTQTN